MEPELDNICSSSHADRIANISLYEGVQPDRDDNDTAYFKDAA